MPFLNTYIPPAVEPPELSALAQLVLEPNEPIVNPPVVPPSAQLSLWQPARQPATQPATQPSTQPVHQLALEQFAEQPGFDVLSAWEELWRTRTFFSPAANALEANALVANAIVANALANAPLVNANVRRPLRPLNRQ